jgi:hypothetical protein
MATKRRTRNSNERNVADGWTPLPDIDAPPLAYSVKEFCARYRFSEDFFYKLRREGRAPAIMKVGSRTLITVTAAEVWQREREAQSAALRQREQAEAAATTSTA